MNKHDLLYRIFGYDSFRPGQEKLIDAVLSGQDVLASCPQAEVRASVTKFLP